MSDAESPLDDELPTDDRPAAAISERALSLVNEAMFTVDLQCRRVRGGEPEDEIFLLRWWADLQFLIVALRRMRRAATLGLKGLSETAGEIEEAIRVFDQALPDLATMRNVGEHIDAYAVDEPKRHHKHVVRSQLQVGAFDGKTFRWLGGELNVDEAQQAAERLYLRLRSTIKTCIRNERARLSEQKQRDEAITSSGAGDELARQKS